VAGEHADGRHMAAGMADSGSLCLQKKRKANSGSLHATGRKANSGSLLATGRKANSGSLHAKGRKANSGSLHATGRKANSGSLLAKGRKANSGSLHAKGRNGPGMEGETGGLRSDAGPVQDGRARQDDQSCCARPTICFVQKAGEGPWDVYHELTVSSHEINNEARMSGLRGQAGQRIMHAAGYAEQQIICRLSEQQIIGTLQATWAEVLGLAKAKQQAWPDTHVMCVHNNTYTRMHRPHSMHAQHVHTHARTPTHTHTASMRKYHAHEGRLASCWG